MAANVPRQPPTATTRRSVFLEGPMDESTTATTISTTTASNNSSTRAGLRIQGGLQWLRSAESSDWLKPVLRATNALLHLAASTVLLTIMIDFMVRYTGDTRRPQAVVLILVVGIDCCLDVYSLARLRKKWQGWAQFLRLVLALGYIAQFMVYVGFRKVFPLDYSYWGMSSGYSEPVVYLLLWVFGIWDLLHVAIHRHALGRNICGQFSLFRFRSRPDNSGSATGLNAPSQPPVSTFGIHQQRSDQADMGHGPNPVVALSLGEIRTENKRPAVATIQSESTSISGQSSSQAGTTVRGESNTASHTTSRRTSVVTSVETSDQESGHGTRTENRLGDSDHERV